jgi:hypothetical protein
MATRRERYLKHRARALRRAKRHRLNYWHSGPSPTFGKHGGGNRWEWENQRQFAPSNCPSPVNPPGHFDFDHPLGLGTLHKPSRGVFPYATFTNPLLREPGNLHSHFEFEVIGFVKRRPVYRGHKKHRMNGFQRRVMGATWWALIHGWYPAWDPLNRDPVEEDVSKDPDAAVNIEWRWGVLGHF